MKSKFSENYQNLIKIYADMHNNGTIWDDAESTFDGKSLKYFFSPIKQIIDLTKSKSLIDFGCGKAIYYFENVPITPSTSEPPPLNTKTMRESTELIESFIFCRRSPLNSQNSQQESSVKLGKKQFF